MEKFKWPEFAGVASAISIGLVVVWTLWPGMASEEAAAWAQGLFTAVGLYLALHIATYQARAALQTVQRAAGLEEVRRSSAILGIVGILADYAERIEPHFEKDYFDYLPWMFEQIEDRLSLTIRTLEAIPVHEAGTADAMREFIGIRTHAGYLEANLGRAVAASETGSGTINPRVRFDGTAIGMNCRGIKAHFAALSEIYAERRKNLAVD